MVHHSKHDHIRQTDTSDVVADSLLDVLDTDERAAKLDQHAKKVQALGAAGLWTQEQVKAELENILQMEDFLANRRHDATLIANGQPDTLKRKVARFFIGR